MSIKDVAEALERVQNRIKEHAGDYSLCSRLSIIEFASTLHWWLEKECPIEFGTALDCLHTKSPLVANYLLTELFKELGCKERGDLDAHLLCKA